MSTKRATADSAEAAAAKSAAAEVPTAAAATREFEEAIAAARRQLPPDQLRLLAEVERHEAELRRLGVPVERSSYRIDVPWTRPVRPNF